MALRVAVLVLAAASALCRAQSCPSTLQPSRYPAPQVAAGYSAQLLVTGLSRPRSVVVDDRGQLLVSGARSPGIVALVLDTNGCRVQRTVTIVAQDSSSLNVYYNHGLALSPDGKTLYASTQETAYSWDYNSAALTASNRKTLVTGMNSGGHITRTLLVSKQEPELLVISRGSDGNLDMDTERISSGRSMIKVFNTTAIRSRSVDYTSGGTLLGWGLRNSVGMTESPNGEIWSVENSADSVRRYNVDFHDDNPGEELNFHGNLASIPSTAPNFGYPKCFSAYDPATIPRGVGLQVGDQFALDPTSSFTDATCNSASFQGPRLTFPAHTAPLAITFNGTTEAFIAFHGSWNRPDPVGYQVAGVAFDSATGQPVASKNTKDPQKPIFWNANLAGCPSRCFRPTGLAIGPRGELYVTGDSNNDIWVIRKTDAVVAAEIDSDDEASGAAALSGQWLGALAGAAFFMAGILQAGI